MLIQFESAQTGNPCWVNPEYVAFVPSGPEPLILFNGGGSVLLKGDGTDVARRLNDYLENSK